MTAKTMLIVDSTNIEAYKKLFREFEGYFIIDFLERTGVIEIAEDYDIYLFNTRDVDNDIIWKLRKRQPGSKIYAINGGNRDGITLEQKVVSCIDAICKSLDYEFVELIYKNSIKIYTLNFIIKSFPNKNILK